ncbi:patatin-like phospholipase family protein [Candidatus Peregrinibacteria bacterium]|nr:patatin-like phospholipase family protein [Candidatus Peregrinibacteria bacterium]
MSEKKKIKKTLGIGLGGGGARGFAHIGILEVLEENGIKPDFIAGTSMGAVIAGLYAVGYSIQRIKEIAINFKNIEIIPTRYLNLLHESLLKSDIIIEALNQLFDGKTFKDCKIPFYTVAIDLESGKEIMFNKGPLNKAILASVSIPIIFPPTFHEDRYLIDGGILENVPLKDIRALYKPDVLIGSKIINYTSRQYISGMVYAKYQQVKYESLFKKVNFIENFVNNTKKDLHLLVGIALRAMDIASKDNTDKRILEAKPDILLEPNIDCGLLEFDKAGIAIEEGRKAMFKELPKLKELLG